MAREPLIAIVEDNDTMRDALAELVEVLNLPCRTFDAAENFLAAHAIEPFDCLITDVRLPMMSGLELQRRLRAIEPDLPVIVISALSDGRTRSRALELGALAFLPKPIKSEALARCIDAALGLNLPTEGPHP